MDRAIVVYGFGGLDVASLEGEKLIFIENGVKKFKINISEFIQNMEMLNLSYSMDFQMKTY